MCLAACLTVRVKRQGSLSSSGECCQGLSRAAAFLGQIQGWDTQGALRNATASQLSEICLHHQSQSQAPLSFFCQKHPFLLLQRNIHQQEMLLFKLGYKNSGQHEHTAQRSPLGSKGCQEGITGLASEEAKLPEILKYPSLQTQEHAAVPLGLQIPSSSHSSHSSP